MRMNHSAELSSHFSSTFSAQGSYAPTDPIRLKWKAKGKLVWLDPAQWLRAVDSRVRSSV